MWVVVWLLLARKGRFSCLGRCVEGGLERVEFMVVGREGDIYRRYDIYKGDWCF